MRLKVISGHGVPVAESFVGFDGTPLYIDLDTGISYFLNDANAVTALASSVADGSVTLDKLGGTITTAGKALLDDADAAAQRSTLGAAASSHAHVISDSTGLQTALDGKAASSHAHAQSDVTNLATDLAGKAASSHTHAQGDITSLTSDLAGKAATSHNHAASDVNSGTIATAQLGSGTANSSSYLRGDQTWATIAGGGDVTGPVSSVDGELALFSSTTGKVIKRASATGLLKAASGVLSAAAAGTDYARPLVLVATLAGDQATGANVTPVTLTGLVFSYEANAKYRIWFMGRVAPTAATTGCGFQFDLSSAVTSIDVQFFHQLANTGTQSGGHSIADDASVGVSSGMPGTSTYPVTGHGLLITTGNTGTAQLRFRSETTAVTTCKAGMTLVVERIA